MTGKNRVVLPVRKKEAFAGVKLLMPVKHF